jgi:hypothetical protein
MRAIDDPSLDLVNELIEFKRLLYLTLQLLLYYSKEYELHDEVDVERISINLLNHFNQ